MATEDLQRFLTDEQYTRILMDRALFADSYVARTRSVKQLAMEYRPEAIKMIQEMINSTPITDDAFRVFCRNVIDTISDH